MQLFRATVVVIGGGGVGSGGLLTVNLRLVTPRPAGLSLPGWPPVPLRPFLLADQDSLLLDRLIVLFALRVAARESRGDLVVEDR